MVAYLLVPALLRQTLSSEHVLWHSLRLQTHHVSNLRRGGTRRKSQQTTSPPSLPLHHTMPPSRVDQLTYAQRTHPSKSPTALTYKHAQTHTAEARCTHKACQTTLINRAHITHNTTNPSRTRLFLRFSTPLHMHTSIIQHDTYCTCFVRGPPPIVARTEARAQLTDHRKVNVTHITMKKKVRDLFFPKISRPDQKHPHAATQKHEPASGGASRTAGS